MVMPKALREYWAKKRGTKTGVVKMARRYGTRKVYVRRKSFHRGGKSYPMVEIIGAAGEVMSLLSAKGPHGSVITNAMAGRFDQMPEDFVEGIKKPSTHWPLLLVLGGAIARKVLGPVRITKKWSLF